MNDLIAIAKTAINQQQYLPFSIYCSHKEQMISNVPIIKPLLIFILNGEKQLGTSELVTCQSGTFVFLSNSSRIDMRNIPHQEEYFAVLIDFEQEDFTDLPMNTQPPVEYLQGDMNTILKTALLQYMQLAIMSSAGVMKYRKKELLSILYHLGYRDVSNINQTHRFSEKIHRMIANNLTLDWTAELIAADLFMSSSTLRRKLKNEGENIQDIRSRTRLSHGLHLLQTTQLNIGHIADQCGYQSQSRFTEQFKVLFGMTPREIRKSIVRSSPSVKTAY
jgi:hypothetical protein